MFGIEFIKSLLKLNKEEKSSKQYISFSDQKFNFYKGFATVEITVKER